MRKRGKAQSTLEYATLIAIVVAALIGMQVYMKRATQGRLRNATDEIGPQFESLNAYIASNRTHVGKTQEITASGVTTATLLTNEVFTKSGSENIQAW